MREATIENYLVRQVREELKGTAYKFTSPSRRAVPDRMVLLPHGGVFFVELKATGAKATPAQTREHERLRELGFDVYVADSKEAVDEIITEWWWEAP